MGIEDALLTESLNLGRIGPGRGNGNAGPPFCVYNYAAYRSIVKLIIGRAARCTSCLIAKYCGKKTVTANHLPPPSCICENPIAASFRLHVRHNFEDILSPFTRGARLDQRTQLKQVSDAKQGSSSPHNDYRIDGTEVGEVFGNRSSATVMIFEIQTVLRQPFPAAQLFEFLPAQRMKRMDYSEPLQPLVTTICSA
jgi:hypothetical protein